MEKIGEKIRKIRELRNFSRKYVACELMVSTNTYGKIERDETELTVRRLSQIAKVLKVGMSTIIDFDENQIFKEGVIR